MTNSKPENSKLYTLIIDYGGGTYVTQAVADSASLAPSKCIEYWDIVGTAGELSDDLKKEIILKLKDESFVPLSGMKNVWSGGILLKKGLMLMNLVETSV